MSNTKEDAKQNIIALLEKHQKFKNEGRLKGLNEETTKQWIDNLFHVLGWDFVGDVVKEYGTGWRKRVDYAFQISGTTKFLLEAKAYGEELEEKYVRQALEYGYQNNKTWVVLTNFREIRVYNAKYYDREEHIRRLFEPIRIEDAVERFDDLWVLSREGMRENLINQLAKKYGKVKPKEAIDSLIFEDLLRWRKLLERGIKAHKCENRIPTDPKAAEDYIDEAVQKILDRIIFVRVCEDRGLEDEEQLRWCVKKWKDNPKIHLFNYLNREFSKKDNEYNSGLFQPHFSQNLTIDDSILKKIIEETYIAPDGLTYDFSAIDADILGTIYENYLGYIQRKVWDKEAKQKTKRKAHGIYYTPTYIVDYIVKNTLGEKLKSCKTPKEALKIKVLDPACGSGSFLIRAFDEYKYWYVSHLKQNGEKQITLINELKGVTEFLDNVLRNCIYGVDLDSKAVELTKLNLLLKAAEGKHKLPNLSSSIQCGNSLIDNPEVAGQKAFPWEEKFSEVFRNGKFDIVIGNPPYGATLTNTEKTEISKKYHSAAGRFDTYYYFIELGINLLRKKGKIGFIVPDTWLTNVFTEKLRRIAVEQCSIKKIVTLPQKVFPAANVDTCIFIFEEENSSQKRAENIIEVLKLDKDAPLEYLTEEKFYEKLIVQQNSWKNEKKCRFNVNVSMEGAKLIVKINEDTIPLGYISDMCRGINPYDKYTGQSKEIIEKRVYHSQQKLSPEYKRELVGSDIGRYSINVKSNSWIKYGPWLAAPRDPKYFTLPHLLIQRIRNPKLKIRIVATYAEPKNEYYNNSGLTNLIISDEKYSLKYLLAILNSKLMNWYYRQFFTDVNIKPEDLKDLPIKILDNEKQKPLIQLVNHILSLNENLSQLSNQHSNKAQMLRAEIEKKDKEIDDLIYGIYGLTDEEMRIIDKSFK